MSPYVILATCKSIKSKPSENVASGVFRDGFSRLVARNRRCVCRVHYLRLHEMGGTVQGLLLGRALELMLVALAVP